MKPHEFGGPYFHLKGQSGLDLQNWVWPCVLWAVIGGGGQNIEFVQQKISAIVCKMSCTSFLKQLSCICTETAAVDSAVNKQLNSAQQIAAGLTPAHKVLIKKQVKMS